MDHRVEVAYDHPLVIRVTDLTNADYHYLIPRQGSPVYGYPVQLFDGDAGIKVFLFVPLPSGIPSLLKIEMPDDPA